jgi:hypothetical protein
MKDPLDGGRTADLYHGSAVRVSDAIIPGEAGATVESEDEKRRRVERERKRKQRAVLKQKKEALNTQSEQEWWAGNRARLKPTELESMVEQDAYVRDLLFSIKTITNVEADPELIDIVVEFVKEHGVVYLGSFHRDQDIPYDWSSQAYWKQPELLAALKAENWQTERHVVYGYLAALPDWRVVEFLHKKAGWEWLRALELTGASLSSRNTVSYR